MLKVTFRAMGCEISAFLDNEDDQAAAALQQAPGWFEEWEQVLSRFRPDSDLNQLNAATGKVVTVHPVLWEVIEAALNAARWTDGLVVPTVLRSLERAGYDRSFDLINTARPSFDPITSILEDQGSSGWEEIRLDKARRTVHVPVGQKLDLGGTAKGWAAQLAANRLSKLGPALVNAGGDIAISHSMADGMPWPVDIADPLRVQGQLDLLGLGACGVATSGIDYRRWMRDGEWKHHIIDPRTSEPAKTDLISATIIAPDVLQAEAAAKVVMILGSAEGQAWLQGHPQLSGILAQQDGQLIYCNQIKKYLWSSYDA